MNNIQEADKTPKTTTGSSGFDVKSLLAPNVPNHFNTSSSCTGTSYVDNTSPKLTAKVVPFALRDSGAMEPTVPQQGFQKVLTNQQYAPLLPYTLPPPLALANLQLYSLWSHANMLNSLPLYMGNPAFAQQTRPSKTEAQATPPDINVTRTVRNIKESPPSPSNGT